MEAAYIPEAAEIVSACCQAPLRSEPYDFGRCPETGYHDEGERCLCVQCGEEAEPVMQAVVERKPVVQAQGELFQQEVA